VYKFRLEPAQICKNEHEQLPLLPVNPVWETCVQNSLTNLEDNERRRCAAEGGQSETWRGAIRSPSASDFKSDPANSCGELWINIMQMV
jgi:hypothetical protein